MDTDRYNAQAISDACTTIACIAGGRDNALIAAQIIEVLEERTVVRRTDYVRELVNGMLNGWARNSFYTEETVKSFQDMAVAARVLADDRRKRGLDDYGEEL